MDRNDERNPFELYQNTGYQNDRKKIHTVIIKDDAKGGAVNVAAAAEKLPPSGSGGISFDLALREPLRIDKLSDIYLDSFSTYDMGDIFHNQNAFKQIFALGVDQFNIISASHNELFHNKVIIPNEDSAGVASSKVHKGRKMNYIGTINPCIMSKISGTITDMNGSSIVQNSTISVAALIGTNFIILTTAARNEYHQQMKVKLTGVGSDTYSGKFYEPTQGFNAESAAGGFNGLANITADDTDRTASGIANYVTQKLSAIHGPALTATASGSTVTFTGLAGNPITGSAITEDRITTKIPHFVAEFVIVDQ